MGNRWKDALFIFLFAVLLLPFTQQFFPFITSAPVYGVGENAPDIRFSWDKWWDGSYQLKKARFINDAVGLRADMIRTSNQLDYTLMSKLHSWKAVEGRDHYLFMDTYIDGYYGRDYVGYDSIAHKLTMLKAISDTLARMGKSVVLVHSPAKEFMYPEYIPESLKADHRATTNLDTYNRISDSLHISHIDFNSWFCSLRYSSNELLYSKQGAHWTTYGSFIAADSLVKYLEKLRNIQMPHIVLRAVAHTEKPAYEDNDIEKTLNLIFRTTTEVFSYPVVSYTTGEGITRPKIIYIGDSFLPIWAREGFMHNTNTDWQVWQWFSLLWSEDSPDGHKLVQDTDWIAALNNTDCVVIMYTSFNLPVLGNGFIEKAYSHYFPVKK